MLGGGNYEWSDNKSSNGRKKQTAAEKMRAKRKEDKQSEKMKEEDLAKVSAEVIELKEEVEKRKRSVRSLQAMVGPQLTQCSSQPLYSETTTTDAAPTLFSEAPFLLPDTTYLTESHLPTDVTDCVIDSFLLTDATETTASPFMLHETALQSPGSYSSIGVSSLLSGQTDELFLSLSESQSGLSWNDEDTLSEPHWSDPHQHNPSLSGSCHSGKRQPTQDQCSSDFSNSSFNYSSLGVSNFHNPDYLSLSSITLNQEEISEAVSCVEDKAGGTQQPLKSPYLYQLPPQADPQLEQKRRRAVRARRQREEQDQRMQKLEEEIQQARQEVATLRAHKQRLLLNNSQMLDKIKNASRP